MSLGKDAVLYIGEAITTTATPAALADADIFENVRDLDAPSNATTDDTSTRENGGMAQTEVTFLSPTYTFVSNYNEADTILEMLEMAHFASMPVFAAGMSKAGVGGRGLAGNFKVTKFDKSQGLKAKQTVSVELSTYSFNAFIKVTA